MNSRCAHRISRLALSSSRCAAPRTSFRPPVRSSRDPPVRSFRVLAAMSGPVPSAAETDSLAAQNAEQMNVTPNSLSKTLSEKIGAIHCAIEDMSGGCGQAFEAIIVSPQFEKKTTLARHRLVNGALKQEIAAIHAWTPRCFTPEEWEKRQAS